MFPWHAANMTPFVLQMNTLHSIGHSRVDSYLFSVLAHGEIFEAASIAVLQVIVDNVEQLLGSFAPSLLFQLLLIQLLQILVGLETIRSS